MTDGFARREPGRLTAMSSEDIRLLYLSSVNHEVNFHDLNKEWDYWMLKGNSRTRTSTRLQDACQNPSLLQILKDLRKRSDSGCLESQRKLMTTLLLIRQHLTIPWKHGMPALESASGQSSGQRQEEDAEISEVNHPEYNVQTSDKISVEDVIIDCLMIGVVKQEPDDNPAKKIGVKSEEQEDSSEESQHPKPVLLPDELDILKVVLRNCSEQRSEIIEESSLSNQIEEYIKFMTLKQVDESAQLCPPAIIDYVWRNHFLCRGEYREFCGRHFHCFVDYSPTEKADFYQATLEAYKKYFGEIPFIDRQREIWPDYQNLGKRARDETLNEKTTPEPISCSTDSSTHAFKKSNSAGSVEGEASSAEIPAAAEGRMRDENEEIVEEETDEGEEEVDNDEESDDDQVLSFKLYFCVADLLLLGLQTFRIHIQFSNRFDGNAIDQTRVRSY